MATKKDNLPLTLEHNEDSTGTITYANEVIAIIAGVAANEVEGVAGMCTSGGISEVFGRNKNITKGVKVEIGTEEA
ncbi:MAG: Asp23/Gls24 family envelope stress response protein, partial [Clostridia bacterium]